jgi:hypothetical protein
MVHALEEIHRMLRPSGTLIDVHPVEDAWVEIRSGEEVLFLEGDPGYDPDDDLVSAENALRTILTRGLFALEGSRTFDLLWIAPTVAELRDHFAVIGGYDQSPPSGAVTRLRDAMYRRAQDVLQSSPTDAEVVYRERARLSRLDPSR